MKKLSLSLCVISSFSCGSDYEIKAKMPDIDPGEITECPFTPISGTKISQYDCNPVYPNEEGTSVGSIGFHVTEVLGHPFYQMWYGTTDGMEYAVSDNGTAWETHPNKPLFALEQNTWDDSAVTGQVVVWDPIDSQYVMSYQGYSLGVASDAEDDRWGIGITTSPDGTTWTKHPNNPVIDFNDYSLPEQDYWNYFCTQAASDPFICDLFGISYTSAPPSSKIQPCWPLTITITERGNFKGYIAAKKSDEVLESLDWATFESDLFSGSEAFLQTSYYPGCHLYSMDAMAIDNWVLNDSQPALSADIGTHEGGGIASAAVVDFEGTLYMFYIGFETWQEDPVNVGVISAVNTSLNIATSTDGGSTWVKDPGNPFAVNRTTPGEMAAVGAQVIGSRIHFWLTDNYDDDSAVGYFYYEPNLESNH